MAFGTESAIFAQTISDALSPTASGYGPGAGEWDNTTPGAFKVALFNDTFPPPGPDREQLAPPTYGVAPWLASEAVDQITGGTGPDWPTGGMPLTGVAFDGRASGTYFGLPAFPTGLGMFGSQLDADDTPAAGTGGQVTLDDVWGDLLYFPTAGVYPNQALAFHSFGGSQVVTAGLFTILWHAAGIAIVTVRTTPVP